MNEDRAQKLVVTSLVVSGGLATIKDIRGGGLPPARLALGTIAAGIMLAALAEFSPDMAGGLAVLMLTTAVFVYGGPAFSSIAGAVGGSNMAGAGGSNSSSAQPPKQGVPA